MIFSFIILHYQVYEDTIECVNSIFENIKHQDYNIVIVDNKSPNRSGELLQEKYKGHSRVVVIELDRNLGFAQGNNYGCAYAFQNYNPDFFIVINNDTVIEDELFVDKISEVHSKTHFDMLGPCIWSIQDNIDQNPIPSPTDSLKKSLKAFIYNISLFLLNFINKDTDLIKFVSRKRVDKGDGKLDALVSQKSLQGVKLHGAAIIFSKHYYNKYNNAFDPRTFMYGEEDILYARVKNDNLLAIYEPGLKILHKEDAASNAVLSNNQLRRRFKFRHSIWSTYVLFRIYMVHKFKPKKKCS